MLCSYKPAALYKGSNEWYIYYYYLHPNTGKYVRFKERFDMNRIRDHTEKLAWANEVKKFMNEKLKEGFNPFTAIRRESVSDGCALSNQVKTVFSELCEDASDEQKRTYTTMYNRFEKFLNNDEYKMLTMSRVDIDVAQAFKTFLIRQKLAKKN